MYLQSAGSFQHPLFSLFYPLIYYPAPQASLSPLSLSRLSPSSTLALYTNVTTFRNRPAHPVTVPLEEFEAKACRINEGWPRCMSSSRRATRCNGTRLPMGPADNAADVDDSNLKRTSAVWNACVFRQR